MYKVAIIDDEPIIVKGLTKSIDWQKYNCRIVGSAEDGQAGMKLIRDESPDILFSDICMPGLDGLSMIAGMKSEYEHMQITILTGYRDFDYAQQAIRLGVTRFLLKPSKMDELEEAIRVMIRNLKEQGITGAEGYNRPDEGEFLAGGDEAGGRLEGRHESEEAGGSGTAENSLEAGGIAQNDRVGGEQNHTEPQAEVENGTGENENGGEPESPASSFIVKNALNYIEQNYREKLKLSDVADKIYVSQWHLSKLLNKHTGQSFSEILNNVRIEKARELLKEPSLRIGDIAEEVGFMDMAHFSRVFKKQVGISANEYRNKILGK